MIEVLCTGLVGLLVGGSVGALEVLASRPWPLPTWLQKVSHVIASNFPLKLITVFLLLSLGIFFPVGLALVLLGEVTRFFTPANPFIHILALVVGLLCILPGQRLGKILAKGRSPAA